MDIKILKNNAFTDETDAVVATYFEKTKELTDPLRQIDVQNNYVISRLIKAKALNGKLNNLKSFTGLDGLKGMHLFMVGLGPKKSVRYDAYRQAAGTMIRQAKTMACKTIRWEMDIPDTLDMAKVIQAVTEGLLLGNYQFTRYKTSRSEAGNKVKTVYLHIGSRPRRTQYTDAVYKGTLFAAATNQARDLANTPPNELTPSRFVEEVKTYFKQYPHIHVEVIDRKKAQDLGMNAFLGVAQGSSEPPFMVVLTYMPKKGQRPLCLVGKGVTFDTGGISIKPAAKMSAMKADMTGAAAVFGAMTVVAKTSPDLNVAAVIPLVENMPSGTAQRPGDVVKAMNGKTIEILNTDAEGRLILADALCYAVEKLNAKEIIDIATLTGACLIALGTHAAAILGNNDRMIRHMTDIGAFTGERVWQLPLYDEYLEQLKSEVADISNCFEGREGGTCTAAKFLEQFVSGRPWIHLDIASLMINEKTTGYRIKGMAGVGARDLAEYVLEKAAKQVTGS